MCSMCSNGSTSRATASQLRLHIAAALMPHPEKVDRGGEDAVFLADDRLAFGEFEFKPCLACSAAFVIV